MAAPIAAVRNGDTIVFDVKRRCLDVGPGPAGMKQRLRGWKPRRPSCRWGALATYSKLVGAAFGGRRHGLTRRSHGGEGRP